MRTEVLNLAFTPGESKYRGYVYLATADERTGKKIWSEVGCNIEDILDKLDSMCVNVLSSPQFKLHYYMTNNTFTSKNTRKNTIFSYNNFVVDLDCHDRSINAEDKKVLLENFIETLKKELDVPMWNITHYTGGGVHLWWCFKQVSYKLAWSYRFTLMRIIDEIDKVLKSHPEYNLIQIDENTTDMENGFFRVPDTYNDHAGVYTYAVIENRNKYVLQDLINELREGLEIPEKTYKTKSGNNKITRWNYMFVQNNKRMNIMEQVIKERLEKNKIGDLGINKSSGLSLGLLIYYSCSHYVYSSEIAKKKTIQLNTYLKVDTDELKSIFEYVDGEYKLNRFLKFKNETIIKFLNLSEKEQDKYSFHAFTGEWDWAKCKPNKTRDEKRRQARQEKEDIIITLYNSGLTQAEVANETGLCVKTITRILKKHNINRKEERIKQIQILKSQKYKQIEIAQILGVTSRTVRNYWNID